MRCSLALFSYLPSVVETIAQLDEYFARVEVVRAAEGEAVVEEDAAVGDVDNLEVCGEAFAEILAERKIKGSVGLEMAVGIGGKIPVGEAGGVGNVSGGVGMPG